LGVTVVTGCCGGVVLVVCVVVSTILSDPHAVNRAALASSAAVIAGRNGFRNMMGSPAQLSLRQ
jgi:hypothetical protein